MYYPFLRAKQFELKALREIAQENPENTYLCPIIEPVKSSFNTLNIAIRDMKKWKMKFVLILNPYEGDFANVDIDVLSNTFEDLKDADWIPGLIYQRNSESIRKIIDDGALENVCLIFKDGIDFEHDSELESLLQSDSISSVVVANADIRASKKKLQTLGKDIIRLDDCFNDQKRNVDYINNSEEQFSEAIFYFSEDNFAGFSDYTTLPKNFVSGGMLPYAIAIHLTYKPDGEMIYIHHFVSDSNINQANIQGKFAEAGGKAVAFFNSHPVYFKSTAINELEDYINNKKYPGLGVLKKISIKHHLQLISNILRNL